jgi:hypothetical protein
MNSSLVLGNVYALRTTDPKGLMLVADPVGPKNERALKQLTRLPLPRCESLAELE